MIAVADLHIIEELRSNVLGGDLYVSCGILVVYISGRIYIYGVNYWFPNITPQYIHPVFYFL